MIRILCWLLLIISSASFAEAKRIVALSPHSVEMLYALGVGERILATVEHADYPQAANNIPRIGNHNGIQMERLLALQPDLVVLWQGGNKAKDIEQIKRLGFKVYLSHPQNLADISQELTTLGKLVGKEQQAQQLASEYQASLAQLQQHYAAKPKVKTFYQLWGKPLMTAANNSWVNQIIRLCGAENIFDASITDYPQVSMESIIAAQPKVILQSDSPANLTSLNWQQWPMLTAVKQQALVPVNTDLLHRASPRGLEGIEQVCTELDEYR